MKAGPLLFSVFALPSTCLSTGAEVKMGRSTGGGGRELKLSEPLTGANRWSSLSQPAALTCASRLPVAAPHLSGNWRESPGVQLGPRALLGGTHH